MMLFFIFRMYIYLIVAREATHECHSFESVGVVNHYLKYGEQEFIFKTCTILISIVNTDTDLPVFLCHGDNVG